MNSPKQFDPFLLRAIEHWLDNANELTYQPIFCFWLTTQGHNLRYSIKSTIFEQGKDVVTINKLGTPCAYQLKGGNINTTRWRTEVKPEIEALIDLPIKLTDPNIKKDHISYLVTNGVIEDPVRIEIRDHNSSKWRKNHLRVIDRGDLLKGFQAICYGILPPDAISYKQLIDLLFIEPDGLPRLTDISNFLNKTIFQNPKTKKEQIKRSLAAGIFYCNLIVSPYRLKNNHVATIHVMTLLCAKILNIVSAVDLPEKYWKDSFELVLKDIIVSAKQLDLYILENKLTNNINSPFDSILMQYREHSALSATYALKLSELLLKDENYLTIFDTNKLQTYISNKTFVSESSLLNPIYLALLLLPQKGLESTANKVLQTALEAVLFFNGRNAEGNGLHNPYYSIDSILEMMFGLKSIENEESFKTRSYYLQFIIDLLVRLDDKEFLKNNWKEISFFHIETFICENESDYFGWRADKGTNRTKLLPKTQSWNELKNEVLGINGESISSYLKKYPEFIPFFILVFPHRLNREIISYLFGKLTMTKEKPE